LGCEETELCIRATAANPGTRVVYEPASLVRHNVPEVRGTRSYMLERSWAEGLSKAQMRTVVGSKSALRSERRYVRVILPRAIIHDVRAHFSGMDPTGLSRAVMTTAVLFAAVGGFMRGHAVSSQAFTTYSGLFRRVFRSASGE
jgi:glucosyl-dolichyl phosphate glucuronosyltransferase